MTFANDLGQSRIAIQRSIAAIAAVAGHLLHDAQTMIADDGTNAKRMISATKVLISKPLMPRSPPLAIARLASDRLMLTAAPIPDISAIDLSTPRSEEWLIWRLLYCRGGGRLPRIGCRPSTA